MAGSGSFLTQSPTRHTLTNIEVVRRFLDVNVQVKQAGRNQWTVSFAAPQ